MLFRGHPSWRATLAFYGKGVVWAVAAGTFAGVATALAAGRVQVGWVIVAVAAVLVCVLLAGHLARRRITYTITSERLTIQEGLLAHQLRQARLERVQHVTSRQSALERLLRVGTVDFETAGEAGGEFVFWGVADPRRIVRTVDGAIRRAGEAGGTMPPGRVRAER